MSTATLTFEKKLRGRDVMPFFQEIPSEYEKKQIKVVVFLEQDNEDIDILHNKKKLQKELVASVESGVSTFSI
jgi:hypothetical protein